MYILDKEATKPLYIQLYEAMKEEILNTLSSGAKLPSVRKVATEYTLSKTTVELAYKQLYAEGYIESIPKSGYFVADTFHEYGTPSLTAPFNVSEPKPLIRYDFFPARLTHDAFPLKLWQRLFIKAMKESLDFGAYGDRQGEQGLRTQIAQYLIKSRGVNCDASQIVVCGGFTDSMNHLAALFKETFQRIAIEHPGYPATGKVFEDYGYDSVPVKVDHNGLNIDQLEATKVKLVYITPSHQYPTGVTMPIPNRMKLLDWAKRVQGVIIEDDYDSELRYQNRPIPSLQGLDHDGNVIYVGTFSKSLSPTLRVSYIVLPHRYLEAYAKVCQMRHQRCPVSLCTQKTLELFMKGGHWERHLRKIRTLNRKKHDLMKERLKSTLGSMIEIISEGGGLAILIRPTITIDLKKLRENALKEGIKLYCASDLYGETWEAIRMGFGGLAEREIEEAIALLQNIWIKTLKA
ncbi:MULTISPECIES: PLP-dependent aminotransferase family protein [unclassified Sulfurospirillum]|uniref:MocR-like pyridoxine biosynthesis transcription factor PdxR n=1 Tax=unclassified Sulfurospirillum TaxID=2618290 RepID=UPI00050003A2|nr:MULTISPECIES: PLP-dependent aminotransferase family protein [unclassified Sulfurospirillum]KFL33167.1 GntR family transcriptional regulator [Sulfurospirillum sp. SCADC]